MSRALTHRLHLVLALIPFGAVAPARATTPQQPAAPAAHREPGAHPDATAVDPAHLQRTVRLLAADAFEGRELGTEGSRAAARYLAAELEALGLEPLGLDGTFLAPLGLVRRVFTAPPVLRVQGIDGAWHELAAGTEFGLFPNGVPRAHGVLRVGVARDEAEVRSVASGDVALALLAPPARAQRWLDAPELADRRPPVVLVPGTRSGGRPITAGPFGAPAKELGGNGEVRLTLLGPWGERLEAGEVQAIEFVPNLVVAPLDDVNVVALLRGAGAPGRPELAEEAIVVSAHRDHIGRQAIGRAGATEEDQIANGADDDASGCAVGLELARCLAAGPRPARSVVFVFVTGEEAGMLGSQDYVRQPAWPLAKTVTNLNLEMLGMPDPMTRGEDGVSRPWLTGFERSTLGEELVARGIEVAPDPRPRMNFFIRSDNVSFAREGIVAHTLSTGGDNPNYHQVRDEWHTLDYAHMARCATAGLAALRALATGELTPRWKEGEPRLGR